MYSLGVKSAYNYVRKALDELDGAEDTGMICQVDDLDLYRLVEGHIVEAAVAVHSSAPAHLLEGKHGVIDEDYSVTMAETTVPEIRLLKPAVRLVSIKAPDSNVLVTDFLYENTPEARKQLNPYVRGTFDDPKAVVMKKWEEDNKPVVRYYSLLPSKPEQSDVDGDMPSAQLLELDVEYIPYPQIIEQVVEISSRVEYPVLNMLVSLVLDSLAQHDAAALYKRKSIEYHQQ